MSCAPLLLCTQADSEWDPHPEQRAGAVVLVRLLAARVPGPGAGLQRTLWQSAAGMCILQVCVCVPQHCRCVCVYVCVCVCVCVCVHVLYALHPTSRQQMQVEEFLKTLPVGHKCTSLRDRSKSVCL